MNTDILNQALDRYLSRLGETRPQEMYKWQATKHFQDTFDLNSDDLAANIDDALSEAGNLLSGGSWFPKGMLKWFAELFPAETKEALGRLFDEDSDLRGRMVAFERWAGETLDRANEPARLRGEHVAKNHFQDPRSMSVYLSFRDPGANYLYKTTMYTFVAGVLGLKHPGNKFDKVIAYREMCDEILSYLVGERPDVIEASDAALPDGLRAIDPNHHLLVQDVVYFMGTYDSGSYETGEGERAGGDALGDAGVETVRYWLYAPGEDASMWDEFYDRGVMGLGWAELGDLNAYASREEMRSALQNLRREEGTSQTHSSLATWQFSHEVKPGDIVFAKRGRSQILGRGVVVGDYEYDGECGRYPHLREVKWTHRGIWPSAQPLVLKTLTDMTDYTDFVAQTSALFEGEDDTPVEEEPAATHPAYDKEQFLSEAFMDGATYDTLVGVLRAKKNIILQGAPGVGNYVGSPVMLGSGP